MESKKLITQEAIDRINAAIKKLEGQDPLIVNWAKNRIEEFAEKHFQNLYDVRYLEVKLPEIEKEAGENERLAEEQNALAKGLEYSHTREDREKRKIAEREVAKYSAIAKQKRDIVAKGRQGLAQRTESAVDALEDIELLVSQL